MGLGSKTSPTRALALRLPPQKLGYRRGPIRQWGKRGATHPHVIVLGDGNHKVVVEDVVWCWVSFCVGCRVCVNKQRCSIFVEFGQLSNLTPADQLPGETSLTWRQRPSFKKTPITRAVPRASHRACRFLYVVCGARILEPSTIFKIVRLRCWCDRASWVLNACCKRCHQLFRDVWALVGVDCVRWIAFTAEHFDDWWCGCSPVTLPLHPRY